MNSTLYPDSKALDRIGRLDMSLVDEDDKFSTKRRTRRNLAAANIKNDSQTTGDHFSLEGFVFKVVPVRRGFLLHDLALAQSTLHFETALQITESVYT
jgi:hypothetical protein